MIKWLLNIVNRRICSADQLDLILQDVRDQVAVDADGYITLSDVVRILTKTFIKMRG